MTNIWGDIYKKFMGHAIKGYVEVGRCGGRISTGVVVLAKKNIQEYFAPTTGVCFDDKTGTDNAFTNTKGSTILELFTVKGKLVVASTHGTRGDVESQDRVAMLHSTAQNIMALKPDFVAWAGDFNPRTALVPIQDALLQAGTSHPDGPVYS